MVPAPARAVSEREQPARRAARAAADGAQRGGGGARVVRAPGGARPFPAADRPRQPKSLVRDGDRVQVDGPGAPAGGQASAPPLLRRPRDHPRLPRVLSLSQNSKSTSKG